MSHPTSNLLREVSLPGTVCLRSEDEGESSTPLLYGHFAVFNRWTEIDSWYEGRFMERIAPGAFEDTFEERAGRIRVLYEHGRDPMIGNKPLAAPDVLREDDIGGYYEARLFDTGYVSELLPALRAGQLGASFRFTVTGEEWVQPKEPTDHNPARLEERTITKVDLYELGPVTFGAYAEATAGVRSGTDQFVDSMLKDPAFVSRFSDRVGSKVAERIIATADGRAAELRETTDGHSNPDTHQPGLPTEVAVLARYRR